MLRRKKKSFLLVGIALCLSFVLCSPALAAYGTERWFKSELPIWYQNNTFTKRYKETNINTGYIYLTSKPSNCNGINACIRSGSTDVKATDVVRVSSKNVNTYMTYKSGYPKGSSVYLCIEDYDYTSPDSRHTVEGYVNYR